MALKDYEVEILNNVEKHGWHSTSVFDPDGEAPDFTYSTGFTKSLNKPDFIIFGLSRDLMNSMLWGIYDQMSAGAVPSDGMIWQDLLEGFDCISKKANHPVLFEKYTRSAHWLWKYQEREGHPEIYPTIIAKISPMGLAGLSFKFVPRL